MFPFREHLIPTSLKGSLGERKRFPIRPGGDDRLEAYPTFCRLDGVRRTSER